MTVIDEQSFGKSWHDGYSPIIFIRLNSASATKNNVQSFFKKITSAKQKLAKKFEDIFVIIDFASNTQQDLDKIVMMSEAECRKLLTQELRLVCTVSAENLKLGLVEIGDNRVMHFQNYYHALDKVNKLRLESVIF